MRHDQVRLVAAPAAPAALARSPAAAAPAGAIRFMKVPCEAPGAYKVLERYDATVDSHRCRVSDFWWAARSGW